MGETVTYHVWVTPTRTGSGRLIAGALSLGTLDPSYRNNIAEETITTSAPQGTLEARRIVPASAVVLARLRADAARHDG